MEYSDPTRSADPYALPDLEIFHCPNDYDLEPQSGEEEPYEPGWYYWYCFPGCMPDSDPFGPFDSYNSALADARDDVLACPRCFDNPDFGYCSHCGASE